MIVQVVVRNIGDPDVITSGSPIYLVAMFTHSLVDKTVLKAIGLFYSTNKSAQTIQVCTGQNIAVLD